MKKQNVVLAFSLIIMMAACKQKDTPPPSAGNLSLQFSNVVGTEPLQMDAKWYKNQNGDSFNITTFNYYISNISLTDENGKVHNNQNGYYLIEENKKDSWVVKLNNVPAGNYKSLKFMIGVDSAKCMDREAQTGALDPALGMYWTWTTSYIMAKMEGTSPSSPEAGNIFRLHIGGFKGENNSLRWITLPLPTAAIVDGAKMPNIHLRADALEWFKTPTTISIANMYKVMQSGIEASTVANNYADMFSVDHID